MTVVVFVGSQPTPSFRQQRSRREADGENACSAPSPGWLKMPTSDHHLSILGFICERITLSRSCIKRLLPEVNFYPAFHISMINLTSRSTS